MKNIIITGITGQVGSYLAERLLGEDCKIIGVVRRTSTKNTERIEHILDKITLEEGDITDFSSVAGLINKYKPAICFNMAASSHVHTSFNQPVNAFEVNTLGPLNFLESIRKFSPKTRFIQASTSEMFGNNYDLKPNWEEGIPNIKIQDENTIMKPDSPYAIAKHAAHELVGLYRKAYNIFATSIICFNTESPRRGDNFVTKKITNYIQQLVKDLDEPTLRIFAIDYPRLKLGNIHASRDWSHAKDIVEGYWRAANHDKPDDFVLSSDETHTVEEFLELAFGLIGERWINWVDIDKEFIRPIDVEYLRGRSTKARNAFGWKPQYQFKTLVEEMINGDKQRCYSCV